MLGVMKGLKFILNKFRLFILINEIFSKRDWLNGVHLKLGCFSGDFFFLLKGVRGLSNFFFTCGRFKLLLNPNSIEDGDSEAVIKTKAFEKGVLALPGTVFSPNGLKTAYVRASFSLTDEEDVDKAIQRLRDAILDARNVVSE